MRQIAIALFLAGFALAGCTRQGATGATANADSPSSGAATTSPSENAAAPGRTAAPPEASPAARPTVHEVTLPAGTELPIVLETSVGSDISRAEQPVRAHLARAVSVHGERVLREGSSLTGVVTDATRSAKVKGLARVAVRFDTLMPRGSEDRYPIQTTAVARRAAATTKKDALEIGGGAVGGALVGALVGGGKGAAIGSVAGGGAGTGIVLSTRGKEVRLPAGSMLRLRLTEPLTVRING
jgi:hypothetical protein